MKRAFFSVGFLLAAATAPGCRDEGDLCKGVDCSGHGTCKVGNQGAYCACDKGFEPQGLQCLPEGESGCGNGVAEDQEECDGNDLRDQTCEALGMGPGTLGCTQDCKLDTTYCGEDSQCGDGVCNPPEDPSTCPGDCSNLANAVAVCAGSRHACALLDSGKVFCWGDNQDGQLGRGTVGPAALAPRAVIFPTGVHIRDIGCGERHTCAVDDRDNLWCWGANDLGQLGTGDTSDQEPEPVRVAQGVVSAAAGYDRTCYLNRDGLVLCAGSNTSRVVDCNQAADATIPKFVPSWSARGPQTPNGQPLLDIGQDFACVVPQDPEREVRCWGGPYSQGAEDCTAKPIAVSGATPQIQMVTAGASHACSIGYETVETVYCWGKNDKNQTGTGQEDWFTAHRVPLGGLALFVAAGGDHTCALLYDGTVSCWGANERGQAGQPPSDPVSRPTAIPLCGGYELGTQSLAAGDGLTCALCGRTDGADVWCWGDNRYRQLGNPSVPNDLSSAPVWVPVIERR